MDWHEGIRVFPRFMHSWFVTVIFGVLFIATLLGWTAVGLRYGYDKFVRGDTPAPPPAAVVPIPMGWKVLSDEACSGSHCSTRVVIVGPDVPTTGAEATLAFTKALEESGFRPRPVGEKIVGGRDPLTIDVSWTAAETIKDATVNVGFTTSTAGRTYWQDAIFYRPVEGFRQKLINMTIATLVLMAALWLTEGPAQDPRRPRSKPARLPRT